MSIHVEWLDAGYTSVEGMRPGERLGAVQIDEGLVGLVIGTNDAVVIEGSIEQLWALHGKIGRAIAKLSGGVPPEAEDGGLLVGDLRTILAYYPDSAPVVLTDHGGESIRVDDYTGSTEESPYLSLTVNGAIHQF